MNRSVPTLGGSGQGFRPEFDPEVWGQGGSNNWKFMKRN